MTAVKNAGFLRQATVDSVAWIERVRHRRIVPPHAGGPLNS
jgi:hypothetical protein